MKLSLLAVLITQAVSGQMSVVENLSDTACEEAICVAKYGRTCQEETDAWETQRQAFKAEQDRKAAYEKLHPKEVALCLADQEKRLNALYRGNANAISASWESKPCYGPEATTGVSNIFSARIQQPGDTRIARCIKTDSPK